MTTREQFAEDEKRAEAEHPTTPGAQRVFDALAKYVKFDRFKVGKVVTPRAAYLSGHFIGFVFADGSWTAARPESDIDDSNAWLHDDKENMEIAVRLGVVSAADDAEHTRLYRARKDAWVRYGKERDLADKLAAARDLLAKHGN